MPSSRESASRLFKNSFFYPILDWDYNQRFNLDPVALLKQWEELGLRYFQWRFKGGSPDDYLRTARELRGQVPGLALLANDHLNLALANRDVFQGIHLGQEDLAALDREALGRLKAAAQEGFVAGISTHGFEQFQAAAQGDIDWAYIALGPMAATSSKPSGTDPVIGTSERRRIFEAAADLLRTIDGESLRAMVLIGGLNAGTLEKILPPDFRSRYGFQPIIASISAAASRAQLNDFLGKPLKYNA